MLKAKARVTKKSYPVSCQGLVLKNLGQCSAFLKDQIVSCKIIVKIPHVITTSMQDSGNDIVKA
jgi:hypothetical protein